MDPNIQRKIVKAVAPGPGDRILEVGPGQGALTGHLAGACGHLTLVELDDGLAAALRERYDDREDVRIIHRDILEVPITEVLEDPSGLKVVGNIPYNITAPILFHLLKHPRPAEIVLMVQKEVADRIVAQAGNRIYGALAVGVQTVATAERLFKVPPGAFRPIPRVDSAVVRITPFSPSPLSDELAVRLRTLTRVAFGWRRKQFQKILRGSPEYGLDAQGVEAVERATDLDLSQRPERLTPSDFVRLAEALPHGADSAAAQETE